MTLLRPFVTAGVSLEHSTDTPLIDPMPGAINVAYGVPSSAIGAAFAASASFGSRWGAPSIEARYTYWSDRAIIGKPTPQVLLSPSAGPSIIST